MTVSIKERSEYFRGLLLLIARDRVVTESETILMKRIGKALGFEKEFCEQAIRDILENPHVANDLPTFSSASLSEIFVKDGLLIARSDNGIHKAESEWLEAAAKHNGLELDWFEKEKAVVLASKKDLSVPLEVEGIFSQPHA